MRGRPDQLAYFSEADHRHYAWQTDKGFFAETERALVGMTRLPIDGPLLEVGCGEGGNLYNLEARSGWAGIDFAQAKLRHARHALPQVGFARADADALPFSDRSFEAVLIRDVLHHVPDRSAVLREVFRVLRPGGVLGLIEPNRTSPLILAQAALVKAERGVLISHAQRLKRELAGSGFAEVALSRAQPFPLGRVVLHPRPGLARFGSSKPIVWLLTTSDALARVLVPSIAWMYLVIRAQRPQ